MAVFEFTVRAYDEINDKIIQDSGVIVGKTYGKAANHIYDYYRAGLISIEYLKEVDDGNLYLFKTVKEEDAWAENEFIINSFERIKEEDE